MAIRAFVFVFVALFGFAQGNDTASTSTAAPPIVLVDSIIAKVNGEIITTSELAKVKRETVEALAARGARPADIQEQVTAREPNFLRDRIDQLLLVQKAKEAGVNVESQVTKRIIEYQKMTKCVDQECLAKIVRESTGQTFEDWKSEMRNGMMTQTIVRQEVYGRMNVSDADKRKYYDEHKKDFVREEKIFLSEIVLSTDNKNVATVEKKAADLVARAKKGEKFGELARDNSESQSAQNFGQFTPEGAKKGELHPDVEAAVWGQAKGFVTQPLKIANVVIIIKVEEVFKPGQAEYEEVENEVTERIMMPKMEPAMRTFLTQLRQEAFLEIKDGYVDSAAAPGKNTAWTDPAQLKAESVSRTEVASRSRRRRLLWTVPVPGTKIGAGSGADRATDAVPAGDATTASKPVKQG
jgi:peptidyl-prolyl cis-trans isomerase SurA